MTADGAYDGEAVYDAVAERHPGSRGDHSTSGDGSSERNQRRRSAIDILQRLKSMDAWVGSVVQATIAGAWSKPQCIATRPLSAGGFTPGLCPISRPRQKSGATCSTG